MITDSAHASKAGHLLTHTLRRRTLLIIFLAIALILIYPFGSSFLLPATTLNPSSPLPESSLPNAQLPLKAKDLSAYDLLSRPITSDLTTIPKIIHQTWFPAGTSMSESAQKWVETVKAHHPDWEYVLWDDESDEVLVKTHFPWFLDTYRSLPKEINRADMARNFYIMYADVDTEALRPVNSLFAAHDVALAPHLESISSRNPSFSSSPGPRVQRAFMGRMAHTLDPEGLGAIPNGWMASPPGHPYWLLPVLAVLENPKDDGSVEGMTGPGILGPLIKQYFNARKSGEDSALRRQLCERVQSVQPAWDLFCPSAGYSLEDGIAGGGEELKHALVLLPREQIYPFSWVDDGDVKSCLGAKKNELFDAEACYPILLTTWHLLFATLCTQLLSRYTSLLANDGTRTSTRMTPTLYMTKIAPIALLYSGSLVCSNIAYVYLNVGFIQMLKASGPVITLLTSTLYGATELTAGKLVNVGVIAASVALTVVSEVRFSWVGVVVQLASLVCDACRLVLLEVLTGGGSSRESSSERISTGRKDGGGKDVLDEEGGSGVGDESPPSSSLHTSPNPDSDPEKDGACDFEHEPLHEDPTEDSDQNNKQTLGLARMDPLLSLYYAAPICAFLNGILAWRAEVYPLLHLQQATSTSTSTSTSAGGSDSLVEVIMDTGLSILLLNALVGFMLNVAVFTLIGKTSGLTMTLVSIPKNILLILASVVLWGANVSILQGVGYAGALGGLVVYAGVGRYFANMKGLGEVRRAIGMVGMGREKRGRFGYEALGKEKGRGGEGRESVF
ncbi:uncharacterized protein BDV17DRAFT_287441 [Aspergillus undulatus]|uniref:uncharacterized protein n=1 Tax=Aspergillus undulatus TaxID=1810928 RepID=UPI003CCE234B